MEPQAATVREVPGIREVTGILEIFLVGSAASAVLAVLRARAEPQAEMRRAPISRRPPTISAAAITGKR